MKSGFIVSRILRNSTTWHVIFNLIILYCVSNINLLFWAYGFTLEGSSLRIQNAYLNVSVLRYIALISFAFAIVLSIYHLSTIFRRKKRNQDKNGVVFVMRVRTAWQRSRIFVKIIAVVIILFLVFTVYTFLCSLDILPKILGEDEGNVILFVIYSITSFSLATLIAGFHMATLILRQKRASDLLNQI